MDIFFDLGKDKTNILVLSTISALTSNTTMEQAALIMMSMDTVYNEHKNAMTIFNAFKKYCILNDSHLANDNNTFSEFKILNTKAFAEGGEMTLDFGKPFTGEIYVYNIKGLLISKNKIIFKKTFHINSEYLNSGIYLINIKNNNESKIIKICKY
jgi:hypothetical protein